MTVARAQVMCCSPAALIRSSSRPARDRAPFFANGVSTKGTVAFVHVQYYEVCVAAWAAGEQRLVFFLSLLRNTMFVSSRKDSAFSCEPR